MNKFKPYPEAVLLICGLFIIAAYPAFAGEQTVEEYPPSTKAEYLPLIQGDLALATKQNECNKNFDINNIDFNDPKVIKILSLLTEYFQCQATVKDSINECNNLKAWPNLLDTCRGNFNSYQALYGRIIRDGRVSPGMASLWAGGNENEFASFMQAFLKEDLSFCDKLSGDDRSDCRAVISGNDSLCKSDACGSKAAYIKAIRSGHIGDCSRIKNNSIKSMCQGYISKNKRICEQSGGFEEFKKEYCQ